jgi:hypothetical protein
MSLVAFFLVGALAAILGLLVALAFARASLYANVLSELDSSHPPPRGEPDPPVGTSRSPRARGKRRRTPPSLLSV